MRKLLSGWAWEALCLLVFVVLASAQLFVRPILGIADNGDFPKVLGPYDICDPDHQRDVFAFVMPRYVIDPTCNWDPSLPSSETYVARINKAIAEWDDRRSFSITGAAKIHLAFLVSALTLLLWSLHESRLAVRFAVPALAILIFTDIAYLGYCNSFYMDAASFVCFALAASAAVAGTLRPRTWLAAIYGFSGTLMAFSKTQHAVTGLLLGGVGIWLAIRGYSISRSMSISWALAAVAIFASAVAILRLTPDGYKAEPLYSLIFYRMLPGVPDQAEVLNDLGLPTSYAEYAGTHSYSEHSPMADWDWRAKFNRQVSSFKMMRFYLRNPDMAFRLLERGLEEDAHGIRPGNLGNYTRAAGRPRGALARSFSLWSDLRRWLLRVFPIHIIFLYAGAAAGSILCLFRSSCAARWPLYPLVLVLTVCGIIEFSFATLLDGTETARHLFFFHVLTEVLILMLVGAASTVIPLGYRQEGTRLRSTESASTISI